MLRCAVFDQKDKNRRDLRWLWRDWRVLATLVERYKLARDLPWILDKQSSETTELGVASNCTIVRRRGYIVYNNSHSILMVDPPPSSISGST